MAFRDIVIQENLLKSSKSQIIFYAKQFYISQKILQHTVYKREIK